MRETRQRGFFGRLLRSIFVIVTGYLAILGLGVTIMGILFGVFIYKHLETSGGFEVGKDAVMIKEPPIEQALLRIKLDRPLTIESIDDTDRLLGQLFNETLPISVDELQLALRRAAEDKRVLGVLLDIDNTGADLSTITSLRRTLEQYTASQKPLYVHLNEGDSSLYYLASVGTKINLAPVSGLTIPGPAFQLTYFGSALERLGLEVEVVRAGRYKSAMEFLIANQPSPETTEMYQSIEGSLRDTLADAISQGRKRSTDEARAWLKRSLFTSQQALTQGLVDRVGYVSDWEEELKTELKAQNVVELKTYLNGSNNIDEPRYNQGDESIGLIEATGEIVMDDGSGGRGSSIAPAPMIEQLKWAAEDNDIKSVVVRVDSPGGSALASDLIWDEVRKLSAKKPVVVSMGSVAASGGYYIAAPATVILAEPTTITGSIGVIGAIPKGLKLAEKWGVSFHVITNSDRRNYLNFGAKSTDEDKAILGESIKETYDTFVKKVAEGRKLDPQRVYQIAEGRVYTGAEALKLGLVDKLGGLRDAMQTAKELAKLDPNKLYSIQRYQPKARNIFDCLAQSNLWNCIAEIQGAQSLLPKIPGLQTLEKMEMLLQQDKVLAYWPGRLTWSSRKED